MREHRQIVERWRQKSASILATLIGVQGSSYRRPGARLVVCKDGSYEGSISAGCLEADLLRKAAWLVRDGSAVERYSTLFDEATEVPFGLGCGGVIDVLLESVETVECQALLQAIESTLSGSGHTVATWLPKSGRGMRRAIFCSGGELLFASGDLSSESLSQARFLCLGDLTADSNAMFVERLIPPQRLYVFGAGDDAKPLVTIACLLGWSVTVVDGRAHLARKTRFPENSAEVLSSADAALQQIESTDAVVIMTHSYEQDRHHLTSLLPLQPRYLGLLGSRRRSSLLITEAAARIGWTISRCCEHISAPVGLEIGGEGPEAIALAIIAEAQACCTGRTNDSRKLSAENVQQYAAESDSHVFMQTHCSLGTV